MPAAAPDARNWLFLHGFGSHRSGIKAGLVLYDAAAHGEGAVAVDQRFHGESTGRLEDVDLEPMLRDVAWLHGRLRDGLTGSRGPLVVVGSSLGGLVAASAIARFGLGVELLVLIAPAFGWFDRLGHAPRDDAGRIVIRNEWLEARLDGDRVARAARAHDEVAIARALDVPTVIFHGSDDPVVPLAAVRGFVATSRGAARGITLTELERGGHRLTDEMPSILAATRQRLARGAEPA